LLDAATAAEVFTPERLTEEHALMARTTNEFMDAEVLPNLARLEQKDWALVRDLMRRCGDLGLFSLAVPEAHGGLDVDKASSLVVMERIARSASFATTFGGQANLTILPLVLFGTEEQQAHYFPRLMSGETIGAYALSETGSGSDALAARTRATKLPDGTWSLTGEKMWISNGGFADLFVVFAKVDGEQFTAFLVERGFAGVSTGAEEHKMGLHGSSTTPLLLQDARVPANRVLGEIGKGHKVALNTLNYGRFSLGAMCTGGCRAAIGEAVRYATGRRQFGQPIASFGAIKHKLGEMIARTYAAESLTYRTAGLIDQALASIAEAAPPKDGVSQSGASQSGVSKSGASIARSFEEYAIEASIAKVHGSETLDFVIDENVQIHGGNGFVSDYPAEGHYRDARVNRIFEGTNEINRLLIPGMLMRRALKGEIGLVAAARGLQDELLTASAPAIPEDDAPLAAEVRTVASFRKAALMVLGTAMQTYGTAVADEQEVLSYAADIVIEVYAAESAVLRAQAATGAALPLAELHQAAAQVYVHDAALRVEAAARSGLAAMAGGDDLRILLAALRRFVKPLPVNTVALRRRLAEAATARGGYILNMQ
jgi:alkylation response protein AidB-like acyl-CoA dehydrogenase